MKKILILEDNITTLTNLTQIVQSINNNNIVYSYYDLKTAYKCAMDNRIDLFIIDIILERHKPGDVSGLEFVENIRKIIQYEFIPVIFVTSLEDARLFTYEKLHCYSFIEKPFDANQIRKVVEQSLRFDEFRNIPKDLYFRKDGIILSINSDDIVYLECINHIMYIHTNNKDILEIPYITLKELIKKIDSKDFIQCSRNTLVNKNFIYNIDIPNRLISLKESRGNLEIGMTFKAKLREYFH